MSERKSLRDMAAEANENRGVIECPKCGCKEFRTYGTLPRTGEATFRYKSCRHCGHRILTTTRATERIIRDVSTDDDGDDGMVLRLA